MKDRETDQTKAQVVPDTTADTVQGIINHHTSDGIKVYADESTSFRGLPNRDSVNHSASQLVKDQARVNGVKSFWAALSAGITACIIICPTSPTLLRQ
ncbi:MAG: transposase [Bacteroidota bacterium]|nr:transposase [Bacteroidota bacterium]